MHALCKPILHKSRLFFSSLFPSPFSLLSRPSLQNTCYFEGVEARRGEMQKVCNIYFLTVHHIQNESNFARHRAEHNWNAETKTTLNYKLGEYYKYKTDCLSNVLHCYSIYFKFCHFCFESATLSKSYCTGSFFKLLFYRFLLSLEK